MSKALTLEQRVERLEQLLGLGKPSKTCTLCKGTGTVNWGTLESLGGKPGPCLCTQPVFEKRRRP